MLLRHVVVVFPIMFLHACHLLNTVSVEIEVRPLTEEFSFLSYAPYYWLGLCWSRAK